jgi:2-polyprenyl-3-methyl-5-hydroxy-6-metoxy-1,4-benzoquinol methylase
LYSKDYYEPPRQELASAIPEHVRTVLSVGCGWGETEAWLADKGFRVTAVPLDPVIPGRATAAGVEVVDGDFESVRKKLANRKFDCLLLLNVLHLVEDPVAILSFFKELLSETSVIISLVPNMTKPTKLWTKARRERHFTEISYQDSGAHFVSHKVVLQWFNSAGVKVIKTVNVLTPRARKLSNMMLGLADSFLCSEFFSIAEVKKEL